MPVPKEARKRPEVLWNWSHRLLWVSMLLLGTELSVSARVARAFTADYHSSPALWFAHHHRACSLLAEVVLVPTKDWHLL